MIVAAATILWVVFCFQLSVAQEPPPPQSGVADGEGGNNNYCEGNGADYANCASNSNPVGRNTKQWRWDPAAKHPCSIHRISKSELLRLHGDNGLPNLYPHPLVVFDDNVGNTKEREMFANLTTLENLPLNFPRNFHVTLTGSDSLSSHRRTIPLKQYLDEVLAANGGRGETLPYQLGNETWYLFGETFTDEWSEFLQKYELPPCQSCTPLHRIQSKVALSFGIGNTGSGVQWHTHGPGFSETIHGRKHWVLYPPESRPEYDLDYASRHWMESTYPTLEDWSDDDVRSEKKKHGDYLQEKAHERGGTPMQQRKDKVHQIASERRETKKRGPSTKKPWECTIHEGEMIYFPDQWHHATINLEKYTVFVSSFTTEHEE